jgi:hypothetical protein
VVFLIGAPRSGTTWLQSLLGAHPDVVTPQETDLFDKYVAPLEAGWDWQIRGGPQEWARRRYKGLPAVVTRARFDELVAALVTPVIEAASALKPGATVLVEKSPSHSLHTDIIKRVLPNAHFLHLIRDGRDVAVSLIAAGDGWGSSWAPRSVRGAAEMWSSHVKAARRASSSSAAYREVRYESLRAGGEERLADIFAFCGVTTTAEYRRDLVQRMSIERMSAPGVRSPVLVGGEFAQVAVERTEPSGFFGGARTTGWREWRPTERRIFHNVAGDLLAQLGYAPTDSWVEQRVIASRATEVASFGARAAGSLLRRASRQADGWASRLP